MFRYFVYKPLTSWFVGIQYFYSLILWYWEYANLHFSLLLFVYVPGTWSDWNECSTINQNTVCGEGTQRRHCIGSGACIGSANRSCEMTCQLTGLSRTGMSCFQFCNQTGILLFRHLIGLFKTLKGFTHEKKRIFSYLIYRKHS